jgi:Skp family chaperone for outer membrane proteins
VATLNAAIAQVQKNLDDAKAELNAKDDQLAAKDNELAAKDDQLAAQAAQLSKLVTVAIVIASIAACGCVALLVLNIIDKRKKA